MIVYNIGDASPYSRSGHEMIKKKLLNGMAKNMLKIVSTTNIFFLVWRLVFVFNKFFFFSMASRFCLQQQPIFIFFEIARQVCKVYSAYTTQRDSTFCYCKLCNCWKINIFSQNWIAAIPISLKKSHLTHCTKLYGDASRPR